MFFHGLLGLLLPLLPKRWKLGFYATRKTLMTENFKVRADAETEVLTFLTRENVRALNLEKITFRITDRGFFA